MESEDRIARNLLIDEKFFFLLFDKYGKRMKIFTKLQVFKFLIGTIWKKNKERDIEREMLKLPHPHGKMKTDQEGRNTYTRKGVISFNLSFIND